MQLSRRQFLALCGASTVALSGCPTTAELAYDPPVIPPLDTVQGVTKVIWLEGCGCSGCSISFLNRISDEAPETAADVLLDIIELNYRTTLMAAAGETAVEAAEAVYAEGGYLLIVEGGIPTAFGGAACYAWSIGGVDITFEQAVKKYAERASGIVCVGNCASFGGVAASGANPAGIKGVRDVISKPVINIAGCPTHPDWIVWTLANLLAGKSIPVDKDRRPKELFGDTVHEHCPRRESDETERFGVDHRCLKELGCRGPSTKAVCPSNQWNGGANWCVDANAPCIGCTEPTFPASPLLGGEDEGGEDDEDDDDR